MPIDASPCFTKTNRAREVLEQLKTAEQELASPPHLAAEFKEEGEWHVLRITHLVPPLSRVSCVVGDVIHNIRCALDHLACLVVQECGHEVTKRTQFPITQSAEKFEEAISSQLPGINTTYRNFIRGLQPFASQDPPSRLEVVHRLDIKDKHKSLVLSAVLPRHVEYQARGPTGAIVEAVGPDSMPFPLVIGTELIRLKLAPRVKLSHLDLNVRLGAHLGFLEDGSEHGEHVVMWLYETVRYVEEQVLYAAEQVTTRSA